MVEGWEGWELSVWVLVGEGIGDSDACGAMW